MNKHKTILHESILDILHDTEMFGLSGACPVAYEPPANLGSKILLITGDNAGGKSLLCRYLGLVVHETTKMEFMRIGMQMRTESGMAKVFVFGDEGRSSTGQLTAHSILGAIHNSRQREHKHMVCLDEPDVGLSEGYQEAAGATIWQYANSLPDLCEGLVVVTHSRLIARSLLKMESHKMRVGDDLRPTWNWLEQGPIGRSMEDFENLRKVAHERFLAVTAIQNKRRAKYRE